MEANFAPLLKAKAFNHLGQAFQPNLKLSHRGLAIVGPTIGHRCDIVGRQDVERLEVEYQ